MFSCIFAFYLKIDVFDFDAVMPGSLTQCVCLLQIFTMITLYQLQLLRVSCVKLHARGKR